MIERFQKSLKDKDQGFTLVELLVVIVIVGILAGIAIPLFLNQRQKGVDAGVQSDLKALATVQETLYTDNMAYSTAAADIAAGGFRKTGANVIKVATSTTGFCLHGENAGGSREFWYDSEDGGLSDSQPGGVCAGTPTFTTLP